jgi:dTDP-4-amino-4,6-dideoxygalactose transaminase
MGHIPLVDLTQQFLRHRQEFEAALAGVCERATFINGPDVGAFEAEFAAFCETQHCAGVSSGLEALHLILMAAGIGGGDEVIVPANTFIATALAVSAVGARPVLVDCEADGPNIDVSAVAEKITPRTRAIIGVHLYGHPADFDALHALAAPHRLLLIEDAAQAHGARYRGRRCGSLGWAAGFSFYPGKNLGAFGDGGAVTTNDAAIADFIRTARNNGERRKYEHVLRGGNWRLDTIQAAVLRVKLRYLAEWNAARTRAAARYSERLAGMRAVGLPRARADTDPAWHLYVIEVGNRDGLVAALATQGIAAGIHYPTPIHLQPAYADLGHRPGSFPNAERQAARVLSLPLFPEITDAQIDRVAAAVREFVG